ncbi:MAG: GGDEF domain-containing protein [Christensenella sp.]|nr:GGDEF domain-containing protein [Christensenella sp.]
MHIIGEIFKEIFLEIKEALFYDAQKGMNNKARAFFKNELALLNMKRIIPIALLLICIEIANMITNAVSGAHAGFKEYYQAGAIFLLAIACIYLIAVTLLLSKNVDHRGKWPAFYTSFWFFFVFGSMLFATLDVLERITLDNYLYMSAILTIVTLLSMKQILIVIIPNVIIMIVAAVLLDFEPFLIEQIILITIAVIVVSRLVTNIYCKMLIAKQTLERSKVRLEKLSETDALTGLLNRRGLNNRIQSIWAYSVRSRCRVSALMLDLDFFKKYNDQYGHTEGDRCLSEIANCLKLCARRNTDFVARVGGEEFFVFSYDVKEQEVGSMARRIQEKIRELAAEKEEKGLPSITISIGGAEMKTTPESSFGELYRRADEALYEAKRTGRNKIVLY